MRYLYTDVCRSTMAVLCFQYLEMRYSSSIRIVISSGSGVFTVSSVQIPAITFNQFVLENMFTMFYTNIHCDVIFCQIHIYIYSNFQSLEVLVDILQ